MCQACWALASRRSGGSSIGLPSEDAEGSTSPKPRFSAVAAWADEPPDDEDRTVAASSPADADR